MKNIQKTISLKIYKVLDNQMPIEEFELWLYENNELLEEKLDENY